MTIFAITKKLLWEQFEICLQNRTKIQKEFQKAIETCASRLRINVQHLDQVSQKAKEEFDARYERLKNQYALLKTCQTDLQGVTGTSNLL